MTADAVWPWMLRAVSSGGLVVLLLGLWSAVRHRRRVRARLPGLVPAARPAAPDRPGPGPERRARPDARLPLAAELLAACMAAGAGPAAAAAVVGGALDGPLARELRRAAGELRLGGDPAVVWGRLGRLPGAAALARRLELAGRGGVPAVAALAATAAEQRGRRVRAARIRAQRAGVWLTGPLGLCFLPAFLLIGVAPVVIGLARTLL
ncbi:type II secretion system F family protein [Streptomyces aidingensis]|uniref:Type II secretion system (T2SS), protein F n=1 Tax=Streptomyces aidingensis TaxID=910347 RepID=A0A1I1KKH8_9ACTN|nr:type II secretion system F family protein [Streptomyces aidingensis]SFC60772.1 Type II secretion system (T2SS), protein F [Streptomyces aidingensis]